MNDNGSFDSDYSADASAHYAGGFNGCSPSQPSEPPRRKSRQGMGTGAVVALCLACSVLAAALGVGGTYLALESGVLHGPVTADVTVSPQPVAALPETANDGAAAAVRTSAPADDVGARVYELAKKQVVGVTTDITYTNIFGQVSPASVSGTGFVISADGYILTNNHVIEDARTGGYEVSVLMYDGTEYTAEIVGYDKENDIAVLKVDAEDLTPVTMGSADDIVVGREVYPVGNPLGELNFSMSTGIISATDRTITTDADSLPIRMFQIDAAVNRGNSGGPVYNAAGRVIGVVTAKSSESGVEGLGFAIPIEDAAHVADQIIRYGYVTDRAALGVTTKTVPDSVAAQYGLVPGAIVLGLDEGGAAQAAGLQPNDIITALNGEAVPGSTELTAMVRRYEVGETVELTVWRAGETLTLSAVLDQSKQPVEATPAPQRQYSYGFGMDDFFREFFGF